MKKNEKKTADSRGLVIEKALRLSGFIFPQTVEQVKEFERIYGDTDILLPPDLNEPNFLYERKGKKHIQIEDQCRFAMAARAGSNSIPPDVKQKIISDIKRERARRKK